VRQTRMEVRNRPGRPASDNIVLELRNEASRGVEIFNGLLPLRVESPDVWAFGQAVDADGHRWFLSEVSSNR